MVEICCGSYYDAKQAAIGGAGRIELNSGLTLGGLTPTLATLKLVKESFTFKVKNRKNTPLDNSHGN